MQSALLQSLGRATVVEKRRLALVLEVKLEGLPVQGAPVWHPLKYINDLGIDRLVLPPHSTWIPASSISAAGSAELEFSSLNLFGILFSQFIFS